VEEALILMLQRLDFAPVEYHKRRVVGVDVLEERYTYFEFGDTDVVADAVADAGKLFFNL
jgi:hypothetical protein